MSFAKILHLHVDNSPLQVHGNYVTAVLLRLVQKTEIKAVLRIIMFVLRLIYMYIVTQWQFDRIQ